MAESNYDKVRENWRNVFLNMDQEMLVKRFGLIEDKDALYMTYFGYEMRIDRKSGKIGYQKKPEQKLTFNTEINIYNMFYYAQEYPKASGNLVPFREVKRVYPFEAAYKKTILNELEKKFTGHVKDLKCACEKLGGSELSQGDAGYRIPVFHDMDMAVLFWDADDEFSAQANMLFDSNITDFMHEENVVGVASDLLYYLLIEAGMEEKAAYGDR